MNEVSKILEYVVFSSGKYELKVMYLLEVLLIFLVTKLVIWIVKNAIFRESRKAKLDKSNAFSLFQISRYFLWVIAITMMLQVLGISITVLLAGSAALLVGIGLGLQQTFNDFISGLILLIEKSIKIGDVLEIDKEIVMIQHIGLRTSKGLSRDEIVIIIPNSLITTNKVINWSHQTKKTRFRIDVGISYGSDVDLVTKVLIESTLEHPDITDKEFIEARLVGFGDSSLNFQVLFFSDNVFRIEKVKSEIRKIINRRLLQNNIIIPFPQMDLHVKEPKTTK